MTTLLVTGGAGFIGSDFVHYLLEESGFPGRVVVFDAFAPGAHAGSLAGLKAQWGGRFELVNADLRDRAAVEWALDKFEVEIICHFAAESHVDRSIAEPKDFITTNILGTFHLLEASRARLGRIRRFHHVSTDEVFGELGPEGAFSEATPYRPSSPYSASKAAADHLVRAWHRTYGLPITISNCSNNYGPRQFPEKLIPLMILNALEGRPLPVYGDGQNVRDWLFVRDHCRAIHAILERGAEGETYCIGGRCEMTNLEVVGRICELLDRLAPPLPGGRPRRSLITFVPDRPGHDRRYAMDCSKIEAELGWRAQTPFSAGLEQTVRWYLEHPEWIAAIRAGRHRDPPPEALRPPAA
ncbi:MAG: dTDP-glucose 4,6-dehydratase [Kiritimatiellae bacterium]|nr:dTDP-glucose 4,6-dehydratase [Kiritimatiellia bacterium]